MLTHNSTIPLFPLNVVLFPGMMLPLHIFEERYKTMVKECLGTGQPFGIVLAKTRRAQVPGVGGIYMDDLHEVGTTAHIAAVEQLADGRLNLLTVGQDRFILREIQPGQDDFLIGRVDPFPVQTDDDPEKINSLTRKLRQMVQRYIDHLADASGEDLSDAVLPTDPVSLAYLAGMALQSPLFDKQKLLSADSLISLMTNALRVLDREDQILVYMLKAYQTHQQVPRLPFIDYSLN